MNSPVHSRTEPVAASRAEQLEIDASTRWPFTIFLASAVLWLIVGGALQLVSSIQLHAPHFLASSPWFTFGRVVDAAQNALTYGWGFNAGFAFALWLMSRLSAAPLRHGGWLWVAAIFWNLSITAGVIGILAGGSTSFELLEMPRYVSLAMLASYALIGVWAITTFSIRNTENVYASQWYIFGAAFWFPWLYAIAQMMLFREPVHGTVQAIVNAWYVNGVIGLWFVPMALAAAYYFLPKITGKPIHDYYLASLGFWWLVVTSAFAGGSRLIGGPVPSWVATLGAVANFMLVVAVIIVCLNLFGTLRGAGAGKGSVTLRFTILSILGFLVGSLLNFALSIRGFAVTAQFTGVTALRDWVLVYVCFSAAMFGAAYFIVPRVTGKAWRSAGLVKVHFATTVLGVLMVSIAMGWGGWQQGRMLNDAGVQFADITKAMSPWFLLNSLGLIVLSLGHLAFAINFIRTSCIFMAADCPAAVIPVPRSLSDPTAIGHTTRGAKA
jgi:cytochrome c oxidase cbb3-type subunit I